MIVDYTPARGLTLAEPLDFKGFKLRLSGVAETRPAIDGIRFADDGHVFIAPETVIGLAGPVATEEWRAGFDKMVAYAASKGWTDPETNAIRAHVERAD